MTARSAPRIPHPRRGGGPADTTPGLPTHNRPVPESSAVPRQVRAVPRASLPACNRPRACPYPTRVRRRPPPPSSAEIEKSRAVAPSAAPWRTAAAARRCVRAHARRRVTHARWRRSRVATRRPAAARDARATHRVVTAPCRLRGSGRSNAQDDAGVTPDARHTRPKRRVPRAPERGAEATQHVLHEDATRLRLRAGTHEAPMRLCHGVRGATRRNRMWR